jgi:hypothetical protein
VPARAEREPRRSRDDRDQPVVLSERGSSLRARLSGEVQNVQRLAHARAGAFP